MKINKKLLAQKIVRLHQALYDDLKIIANTIDIEDNFWEINESRKIAFVHLAEVANIPIPPLHYYESMRHFALNYACQSTESLNQKHQINIDTIKIWLEEINIATN